MIDAQLDRPMDQPDPGLVVARAVDPSGPALPSLRRSVIAVPLIDLSDG